MKHIQIDVCKTTLTETVREIKSLSFARKIGGRIRRQRPNYLPAKLCI